jgi:hypothetical protein
MRPYIPTIIHTQIHAYIQRCMHESAHLYVCTFTDIYTHTRRDNTRMERNHNKTWCKVNSSRSIEETQEGFLTHRLNKAPDASCGEPRSGGGHDERGEAEASGSECTGSSSERSCHHSQGFPSCPCHSVLILYSFLWRRQPIIISYQFGS